MTYSLIPAALEFADALGVVPTIRSGVVTLSHSHYCGFKKEKEIKIS